MLPRAPRKMLCDKHLKSGQKEVDNRRAWQEFLQGPNFGANVLAVLIKFYLSLEASSCELERNLSRVRKLLDNHGGVAGDAKDLECALELMLDGPRTEAELFSKSEPLSLLSEPLQISKKISVALSEKSPPQLLFTELSREMAELWLQLHGRRFHLYKKRCDAGETRGPKRFSEQSLIQAQKRARKELCLGKGSDTGICGTTRRHMAKPADMAVEKLPAFDRSAGMQKFKKTSKGILSERQQSRQKRDRGQNPYPVGRTVAF